MFQIVRNATFVILAMNSHNYDRFMIAGLMLRAFQVQNRKSVKQIFFDGMKISANLTRLD